MPKFTVKELLDKAPSIDKIAFPGKGEMDIYTSFRLSKFVKFVSEEITNIRASVKAIYEKHGTADTEGNIKVPPEKLAEFTKELAEFTESPVDVPNVDPPIPLSKFEKIGLAPLDVSNLEFLIGDSTEPTKP